VSTTPPHSSIGQPTWEIARLFPDQGYWSETDYLALNTNQLVEFVDGRVEVLPMPTELHQLIVRFLFQALFEFTKKKNKLGLVLFAPLRVKLWEGRIREPDIVFLSADRQHCRGNKF
jgi:Uma2 family endonuclease